MPTFNIVTFAGCDENIAKFRKSDSYPRCFLCFVFENQPFTNVKNSWSEKFFKIHRKALQVRIAATSAEVYEYLWANFMSLKASNSSNFIKKELQHFFQRISKTFKNTFFNKLQHFTFWQSHLTILTILTICWICRFEKERLSESRKVKKFLSF